MTENKRFTLEESLDCYNYGIQVVDIIKDNGIELPQSTACDLLNKLSEENNQLKHRLSQQEMEYATTECRQAEENEQLRKEIERKEKIIQDKSELVRQQVNVSENLQARINILERALEEEE